MNELAVLANETHEQAVAYFKVAEQYGYKFIMQVKEIRDKQYYKALDFTSFDDYCQTSWNTKRDFMDQRILIADSIGNERDFADTYRQLGHSKSLMFARMEPEVRQQIESTIDVAETPVKEIKLLEKKLKEAEYVAQQVQAAHELTLSTHTQQQEALLAQIAELKLVKDSPETLLRIAELEAEAERQENFGMKNVELKQEMKRMEQTFNEKISKRDEEIYAMRELNGAFRNIITTVTAEHAKALLVYERVAAYKPAHEAMQDFIKHFDPLVQSIFQTWREASNLTAEEVNINDEQ